MEMWNKLLTYLIVFAAGGFMCVLAQLLIIKTKLTPARILVIFLVAGVMLEAVGLFSYLKEFAKSGVTVPILGFGATLARGSIEMAKSVGFAGAFAGGLIYTAYGVGIAIVASFLVTLIFSPKSK